MREIKFRWYDTHNKRMVNDCFYGGDSKGVNEQIQMFSRDLIPMQFTGIKDRNGKEIYEGDIVKWGMDGSPICTVVFDASSFKLEENTQEANQFDRYDHRDIEIIGNVYENPDLLK